MNVLIYTDGSAQGSQKGCGGWAALIVIGKMRVPLYGELDLTTCNRAEMIAAAEALEALKPCTVTLHSDSQYLIYGMSKWMTGWKRRKFLKKGKPIPNVDLWKRLLKASECHKITWEWVRGHAGHPENEWCDRIAVRCTESARLRIKKNGRPPEEPTVEVSSVDELPLDYSPVV